jgi:hypothetical protein
MKLAAGRARAVLELTRPLHEKTPIGAIRLAMTRWFVDQAGLGKVTKRKSNK